MNHLNASHADFNQTSYSSDEIKTPTSNEIAEIAHELALNQSAKNQPFLKTTSYY